MKYLGKIQNDKDIVTKEYVDENISSLEQDIGDKANDNAVVHNSGIETINGIKTFTTRPKLNNGTSILPSGYQQLDYIQSSGSQYINTGVIPTATMSYEIKVGYIQTGFIFGCRTSNASNITSLNFDAQVPVKLMARIGSSGSSTIYADSPVINNVYTVKIADGNSSIFNETTQTSLATSTTAYGSSFANLPMYLFTINNNGSVGPSNYSINRIYGFIIKNNGTLYRNYIPCYRTSDNVVGMYETVNDVFYINNGTGEFIKGDNIVDETNFAIVTDIPTVTNTTVSDGTHTLDISGKQDEITSSNKLSYNLLSDTPTIPTVPSNVSAFTNDVGYLTSHQSLSSLMPKSGGTFTGAVTANANITEKGILKVQNGSPNGCMVVGADVSGTTLTNGTRKLGRMAFPTQANSNLNCSYVSLDTNDGNSVELGGRSGDTTTTSPDYISFTTATTQNSTSSKTLVAEYLPTKIQYFPNGGTNLNPNRNLTGKWEFYNNNTFLNNGKTYTLPNKTGTIALIGDNVSAFTNDAGYLTSHQDISNKANLVNGKIPASELPSYVDDALEGTYINSTTFNDPDGTAYEPEKGKIYVDTTSNLTYRWSGSVYTKLNDVDFSDYYNKSTIDGFLEDKVSKETGKGLFSGSYNDLTDKPTIPNISGKQDTLTAGTNITIENNVISATSGGSKKVYVEVTPSSSIQPDTWISCTSTKTYQELIAAYDNGDVIIAKMGNYEAQMTFESSNSIWFACVLEFGENQVYGLSEGKYLIEVSVSLSNNWMIRFNSITDIPTNVSAFTNDAGYLTSHQDISGKADKDADAVSGNFAVFDSNGNPIDSGKKPSDFDRMVVNVSVNSAGEYYADKTYSEIVEAVLGGIDVYVVYYMPTIMGNFPVEFNPTMYNGVAIIFSMLYTSDPNRLTAATFEFYSDGTIEYIRKDIDVIPTKTSDLTNDSGFLTSHQDISGKQDKITSSNKLAYSLISGTPTIPTVPTNVSAFTNDAGYLTQHQNISGKVDKTQTIAGIDFADNITKNELNLALDNTIFVTESDCTIETDATKGVSPYSTSYGYTNITINTIDKSNLRVGLSIMMICSGGLVINSTYRNVRIRLGTDDSWHPVYVTTGIAAGSSYLTSGSNRILVYRTDVNTTGAFHISTDSNTTYSPMSLGFGYATCSTAAATAAKVATLSSYSLVANGIVAVKFTYDVPASATLNINSKGAKAIYHNGAAITSGVIKAGDIATFVYNSQYHLIGLNRDFTTKVSELTNDAGYLTLATLPKYNGGVE